jgi:hypothetical protein
MINHPTFRQYPPVDTKEFLNSVKSFRFLMEQGTILQNRLSDSGFAHKLMTAAQEGKKAEVDRLIKLIGLKVPVITKYTPSHVNFQLVTLASQQHPESCCTLTFSMKWGK